MQSKLTRGLSIALLGFFLVGAFPVHAISESDRYLAEAQEYFKNGKLKAAVIQLKNSLKSNPSNAQSRLMLGKIYLAMGDYNGAEKELGRAGRLGAAPEEWTVGLAQALFEQGNIDGILERIQPTDAMSPKQRADVHAIRGNAYFAKGEAASAGDSFDRALAEQPDNPTASLGKAKLLITEKKVDAAMVELGKVLENYPDHAATRVVRGELYRDRRKFKEAIADLTVAIDQRSKDLRAYIGRALSYLATNQLSKANSDIAKINRIAPGLPIGVYLNALLKFQTQDYERAGELLEVVLRKAPGNQHAQTLYGVVTYANGSYALADEHLTRAVETNPNNTHLRKILGASRLKLKEPRRAIEALEPILEQDGEGDVQVLALLGTAYMLSGDSNKGSEYMSKAVELAPNQAVLRTQLAAGQIASGDPTSAIAELESAVKMDQELIQADVLLVISYLNTGDPEKAVATSEALEKRMPDSPIPLNLTGLAYLAQEKFEPARAKFAQALEKDPKFVVANMNLARAALANEDHQTAAEQFNKVLEKDPKHVGAMLGLAGIAVKQGYEEEAERLLVKANAESSGAGRPAMLLAELYLRNNRPLKATSVMSGMPPEVANNPASLRLRGMALLQSGEFSSARREFEKLVELEPENIEGWFQLARSEAASGDSPRARKSFERAIELDKLRFRPLLWVGAGELALRDKRFDDALVIAADMQKYFPKNAMSYEIEAAAYRGKGNIRKAITAVENAVKAEGTSKRMNMFAHILAATGDAPKGAKVLEEWLENNPDDAVSWTTLGMIRQQLNREPEAITAYENVIKINGENPVVLNNLAWLYLDKQPDKALNIARQAYDIAPERAEIVDTYGWVLFQRGKTTEALNVLQEALVIAPRNAEIGLHVAEALVKAGRQDEARPLLERIAEEHQGSQHGTTAREMLVRVSN